MMLALALLQTALQPLAPRWFGVTVDWPDTLPAGCNRPAGRRVMHRSPGRGAVGATTPRPAARPMAARSIRSDRPNRPARLRVVYATGTGRITISGRLTDVCEELDRLAALEARGNRTPHDLGATAPAGGGRPAAIQRCPPVR